MFKLIGVIAGFALGDIIGAIAGLMLGYFLDRLRLVTAAGSTTDRQTLFLETLFIAMGKLAKADGQVSQDEINHAELFMHKLGMTQPNRERAIALFKKGAASSFNIEPTCQKFMKACEQYPRLNQILLVYLIVMTLADADLHKNEEATLAKIANLLGYNYVSFSHLLNMVFYRSHFTGDIVDNDASVEAAYLALGLVKDSSQQSVNEAYHKLADQYRPEQLLAQGVPEDMISMIAEQAREIDLAYNYLSQRNLR